MAARKKPTPTPDADTAEKLRAAVTRWALSIRLLCDDYARVAHGLMGELKRTDSPLRQFLEHSEVSAVAETLGEAATSATNLLLNIPLTDKAIVSDPLDVIYGSET